MPLWPFCPSPVITESLAWLSTVLDPYSSQQVAALRDAPRQGFQFDHVFSFRQYERAQLLMEYAAHGDWDLPVWPERQRLTINAGISIIPIDTTTADFREGGKAFFWQTDEVCEAIEIDTIAPDSITLATPTVYAYRNGFVGPARVARSVNGLEAPRSVQPLVQAAVEWMVYDSTDLAESSSDALYPEYRSYPIVTDAPCVGGSTIDMGVSRDLEIIDGETGQPYFDTLSDRVRRPLGMGWMVQTPADLWALRAFLHALRGRQKAFWLPSWARGMQLAAPIAPSDTTITIRAIGLNGIAETGDLMLKTAAGAQTFLRYTSVAPSGSNEVLTLSAAAGVSIGPGEERTLCRMHLCRQSADRVELRHEHTGANQITTVLIRAEEVPIP